MCECVDVWRGEHAGIIDMGTTRTSIPVSTNWPIQLHTDSPRVISSARDQGALWLICDQREKAAVTRKNSQVKEHLFISGDTVTSTRIAASP